MKRVHLSLSMGVPLLLALAECSGATCVRWLETDALLFVEEGCSSEVDCD